MTVRITLFILFSIDIFILKIHILLFAHTYTFAYNFFPIIVTVIQIKSITKGSSWKFPGISFPGIPRDYKYVYIYKRNVQIKTFVRRVCQWKIRMAPGRIVKKSWNNSNDRHARTLPLGASTFMTHPRLMLAYTCSLMTGKWKRSNMK